jgi:arylsulfatase
MKARPVITSLLASAALLAAGAAPALAKDDASTAAPAGTRGGYPLPPQAPAGAPNVLLVLTDDVGFGASSTFGGPIPTPNLDRLARQGLTYNQFHTTAMCSPTRAALLTGRNHHAVGMGGITDISLPEAGYNSRIPESAATLADVLRRNGYNTAMFGKHHLTPSAESTAAGPFNRWPTGLGFEYFYGFLGGETDQWKPDLIRGISRVDPPEGMVLDDMLSADAIRWINDQKAVAPDKPFFIYLAPGTAHAPLQAPPEWMEKFKGKFDGGWDAVRQRTFARQKRDGVIPANAKLTSRPEFIPAWDSLSSARKRIAAREMEVYAAQLANFDEEFGKIVDEIDRLGQRENTLIVFIQGDNGASIEGGPMGTANDVGRLANGIDEPDEYMLSILDQFGGPDVHAHYPEGWAWAMGSPFPLFKRFASHLGGMRNGMVISWPERISDAGAKRSQFSHVIDIFPTVLEAARITPPQQVDGIGQQPVDGISMAYTFAPGAASAPSRHSTQYFELLGNRSIYKDGWLAATLPPPQAFHMAIHSDPVDPNDYDWALYNLDRDFSQSTDVSGKHPDRLADMKRLWQSEAERNNVLPLAGSITYERQFGEKNAFFPPKSTYVYHGKGISVPYAAAPAITSSSFRITAKVTLPSDNVTGVVAASGDKFGGWSFYLKDGRPMVTDAFDRQPRYVYTVGADRKLPAGPVELVYEVAYRRPGPGADVTISANGDVVARGSVGKTIRFVRDFDVGRDTGETVTDHYPGDGLFPGEIEQVKLDLVRLPPAGAQGH